MSSSPYVFADPVFVTKPHLPNKDDFISSIDNIWESKHLTNSGPKLRLFEKQAANYLKVPHASAYINGHYALEAAIRSLNLTGEVITTPFTFPSTTHAITLSGLKPVFCDIDVKSYNITAEAIEPLITDKTSAIVAVHLFGTPCDVSGLEALATKYNLKLLFDAAHAFGVEINGKGIGEFGDLSMFSLHATKVFNSIEGGLVTYKNSERKGDLSKIRNFGYSEESVDDDVSIVGSNMKMGELHAAIGLLNLITIDELISKRENIYLRYTRRLDAINGLRLISKPENNRSNYSYFPIVINPEVAGYSRKDLSNRLREFNVFSRNYFSPLCTELTCYKDQTFYQQALPNAKSVSDNILCLPIFPDLDLESVDNICNIIKSM